jgi:hypothetical protein
VQFDTHEQAVAKVGKKIARFRELEMDAEADHLQGILNGIKSRQDADAERVAKVQQEVRERAMSREQERLEEYDRMFANRKQERIAEFTSSGIPVERAEELFERVDRPAIEASIRKVVGLG